jgi:hypothetical protein
MTKQELHVLNKIIADMMTPTTPSSSLELFEGLLKHTVAAELVPGTPNHKLLESEEFKAGWNRCYEEFRDRLLWLFRDGSKQDQIKYAGHPKKQKENK